MSIRIRKLEEKDIDDASLICCEAFGNLHDRIFGRRIEFVSLEVTKFVFNIFISNPKILGLAAVDENDKILGTNFLDTRDEVAAVGPISVASHDQVRGVGHSLMNAVLELAKKNKFSKVRLVQEAHNVIAYSLYLKVGFVAQDQITVFEGKINQNYTGNLQVRVMTKEDMILCNKMHKRIVGVSREYTIEQSLKGNSSFVAINTDNQIIGYTTGFNLIGHTVVESGYEDEAVHALYHSHIQASPDQLMEIKHTFQEPSPALGLYMPSTGY